MKENHSETREIEIFYGMSYEPKDRPEGDENVVVRVCEHGPSFFSTGIRSREPLIISSGLGTSGVGNIRKFKPSVDKGDLIGAMKRAFPYSQLEERIIEDSRESSRVVKVKVEGDNFIFLRDVKK